MEKREKIELAGSRQEEEIFIIIDMTGDFDLLPLLALEVSEEEGRKKAITKFKIPLEFEE